MHGNSQRYFKVSKNVVTATLFKGTLFGLFKKMFRLWRKDLHIKRISLIIYLYKKCFKAKQIAFFETRNAFFCARTV